MSRQVHISEEQWDTIKTLIGPHGSVSSWVREAVDHALDDQQQDTGRDASKGR